MVIGPSGCRVAALCCMCWTQGNLCQKGGIGEQRVLIAAICAVTNSKHKEELSKIMPQFVLFSFYFGLFDPLNIDGFIFLCLLKIKPTVKIIANYPVFVYRYTATNPSENTAEATLFPPAYNVILRLGLYSPNCIQWEIGLSKMIAVSCRPSDGFYIFHMCLTVEGEWLSFKIESV